MTEARIFKVVLAVLLSTLAYIWQQSATRLAEIDKSLVDLRVQVVRIESQMMTRQDVQAMIDERLKP